MSSYPRTTIEDETPKQDLTMSSCSTIRQHYYRHPLYDKMVDRWDLFNTYVGFFRFRRGVLGMRLSTKQLRPAMTKPSSQGKGETQQRDAVDASLEQTNLPGCLASIAYQHTNDPEALVDRKINWKFSLGMRGLASNDWPEFGDSRSTPRDGLISFIENQQPSGESDREIS